MIGDDLVILCRTGEAAERSLGLLQSIVARLDLELHPDKTRIVDLTDGSEGFDFLGFTHRRVPSFRHPGQLFLQRWPSHRSRQRICQKIHMATASRTLLSLSLEEMVARIAPILRGWGAYFRWGNSNAVFTAIDSYVTWRLAIYLRKKHQRKNTAWALVAFALLPYLGCDLALFSLFGVSLGALEPTALTAVQRATPAHVMGRVMGALMTMGSLAVPLGALLAGSLASAVPLWVAAVIRLALRGGPLAFPAAQLLFLSPEVGYALVLRSSGPVAGPTTVVVYRTADGGQTWTHSFTSPLTTSGPVALTRIGTRGVALVGLPGVFLSPGGAWRSATSLGAFPSTTSIAFATKDVWYAIHGNGFLGKTTSVYRTTDAGRHWSTVAELPSVAMGAGTVGTLTADGIMFSSAHDGLIWGGGAKGRPLLLTTSDGGHRWLPAAIDHSGKAVAGSMSGYVVTPTFYGRQEAALVLAFGAAIQPAYLYMTGDGGRNWSLPRRFPGYLFSTTDGQHLYAAANNALWTSSDGGLDWQAMRLTGGYSFDTLDFVGAERGFALIGRGHEVRLVETRDGGRTWTSP